jgi:hypothetical protein
MRSVSIADAPLHASAVMCCPYLQILNGRDESTLLEEAAARLKQPFKQRFEAALAKNSSPASGTGNAAAANEAIPAPPAAAAAAVEAIPAPPAAAAAANPTSGFSGTAELQVITCS